MTGAALYVVKNTETGLFAGEIGSTWVFDVRDALKFKKPAAASYAADAASLYLGEDCSVEVV